MMWPYGGGYGMMGGYGYGGWGLGLLHSVFWLIVIGLVVWAIVAFVRAGRAGGVSAPPRRSAGLDILEERYARGEIERDDYLQKKRDLTA